MSIRCDPIPRSALGEEQFNDWPVWSEYYDWEELDEIESWGVSREEFLAKLELLGLGNEHAAYPVLKFEPIPDRMRIYIKARFVCNDRRILDGYVVNPDPFAFHIFAGGQQFSFNLNLEDLFESELAALANRLQTTVDRARPVYFETEFHDDEGRAIAGALQ